EVALRLHRNLEAVEVPGRAPLLAVVQAPAQLRTQRERMPAAEHAHRRDDPRVQDGRRPREYATPALSDQMRLAGAQRPHQPGDVTGERPRVVTTWGLVRRSEEHTSELQSREKLV